MVDSESKYYRASSEDDDSQPVTIRLGFKVATTTIALIGGSCLVLMAIATTITSSRTLHRFRAGESTNLAGLSPVSRLSSGWAGKPGIVTSTDAVRLLGSTPLARIALSAIELNNLRRMREVKAHVAGGTEIDPAIQQAESKLKTEVSNVDDDSKDMLSKAEDAVQIKAHEVAGVTGGFFRRRKNELKVSEMAGITQPLGFFDPMGFSTDASDGKLLFFREVELKHGRVAMLASLGILVGEQFHPLFGGNIDVPSYIAFQQTPLQVFWPAVLCAIAIPEIVSINTFQEPDGTHDVWFTIKHDHQPGDLGFDPLGLKPKDANEMKIMQTKELNNGRLAMIAAAGMIAQELATGQKLF